MLFEIFHVLIWVTTIMLAISGLDDLYVDLMYWFLKRKHRASLPDFSEMYDKPEKPIAIILGAWNESGVIGRTLSFAVANLRYSNYRIFVGVYPNDKKTIDVVSEISKTDNRVKMVVNPRNGPTTKADNLNCMYAALCDFEQEFGEFEILLVHDAEDFIHPRSLKLYNYLIGYRGYHGIQIPVVPIKSSLGNTIHRTYCDAFAETHTKDMIIRQEMKTFMPFSGTGMGFHRKAMYCIEKQNSLIKNPGVSQMKPYFDRFGRKVETDAAYFGNSEQENTAAKYYNNTKYKDNPFEALTDKPAMQSRSVKRVLAVYTSVFLILVLTIASLVVYHGISLAEPGSDRQTFSSQEIETLSPEIKTEVPFIQDEETHITTNGVNTEDTVITPRDKTFNVIGNNLINKGLLLKY